MRGSFRWANEAKHAFDELKEVMSTCPVLDLLDFAQVFVLQSDASREAFGVVLVQNRHSITYESRKFKDMESLLPL